MPLITLTPAQFRQTPVGSQPGAKYQNYINYITRRRAGLGGGPTAPAPLDPMAQIVANFGQIPNSAQVLARSRQAVADAIAASTAANNAAIATQNTQLGNQATRAQGFALALAQATKANPDQIKGYYQEAADRLRGYGTGLTGAVAADQQAQTDATKAAVDRVTGGLGSVTSYDPAALRNAAQMAGVVIPGSSLESQAANAAVQALYANQASAGNIENLAQGYLGKQNELQAQTAAQNAALQAQRPQLIRQELASETSQNRSDMATLLSALGLMNTQRNTTSLINTRTKKAQSAFDSTKSKALGYRVDQYGHPLRGPGGGLVPLPGWTITAGGDRAVKKPGAAGGGSPTHLQSKTINGNIVMFDPVGKKYYLPGDTTNPIDPNTLKGKNKIPAEKMRQYRVQATTGIAALLAQDRNVRPKDIYFFGVGQKKIPGWLMVAALKKEALNHKGDPAWQAVLAPGWAAGK